MDYYTRKELKAEYISTAKDNAELDKKLEACNDELRMRQYYNPWTEHTKNNYKVMWDGSDRETSSHRRGGGKTKKYKKRKIVLWTDTRFKEAHKMYKKLNYKKMSKTRKLNDISNTTEYAFQKVIN